MLKLTKIASLRKNKNEDFVPDMHNLEIYFNMFCQDVIQIT